MPIPLGILAVAGAGAAGGGPAFDLLQTVDAPGGTSEISITGLGSYSDYKHLQIRATIQATQDEVMRIRFNGDTTSNYWLHYLRASGATINIFGNGTYPYIEVGEVYADDVNPDAMATFIMDILDFSSSNKRTVTRVLAGQSNTDRQQIYAHSGLWLSTAAVTSMSFGIQSGTITNKTRFSIYGIRG